MLELRSFSIQGNWQEALDERVRDDLRKHRTYNPKAVRDLLRALRNKKHHYNELPGEVKAVYGRVPDQFADYWRAKFPRLLVHAYHVMHCVKNEPTFQHYFDKNYDFLQVRGMSWKNESSNSLISPFYLSPSLFLLYLKGVEGRICANSWS